MVVGRDNGIFHRLLDNRRPAFNCLLSLRQPHDLRHYDKDFDFHLLQHRDGHLPSDYRSRLALVLVLIVPRAGPT
jgi:hypothetical protein